VTSLTLVFINEAGSLILSLEAWFFDSEFSELVLIFLLTVFTV